MGLLQNLKLIVCWFEVLGASCPAPESCHRDGLVPSSWTPAAPQQHTHKWPEGQETLQRGGHKLRASTWPRFVRWEAATNDISSAQEKHQISGTLLLSSPAPISSPFLIFAFSRFCCLNCFRVPCHGNTCRWRQSSSSSSSASAEEVTNHSTSREVLSPRYPGTICKRGCPWSTRFSQVFSLLLRTSVKALFPLFASHLVPCLCYFTLSGKLSLMGLRRHISSAPLLWQAVTLGKVLQRFQESLHCHHQEKLSHWTRQWPNLS